MSATSQTVIVRGVPNGGYRLPTGTQRKLQSVTGARWLRTRDRRFGRDGRGAHLGGSGAQIISLLSVGAVLTGLRAAGVLSRHLQTSSSSTRTFVT